MQKTDFNRDWTVQKDGSTEILHVNLPDDAMIREERSKENKTASASAYFAGGKYIYTKIFDLSENETRQTLILEFEAVYQNAIVFLNGRQVPNVLTDTQTFLLTSLEKSLPEQMN